MTSYFVYVRKSSEDADHQVLSIESQISELMDFARRKGLTIDRVFTETKSAKKPGREVFNQMIKTLWKSSARGVLCWKLDRLARNSIDGGQLIYSVEEGKIAEIVSPGQTYKNTTNDKFWMQLEFGMAKKYVDDLSDNVRRGLKAKLGMGWFPGLAPIGYLNEKFEEKGRKTIVKDPDRFPLIRKMWDLMLTGNYSVNRVRKIATWEWGLRSRRRRNAIDRPVSLSETYRIFTNQFYSGLFAYNGQPYQGKHEAMITPEEFERVQVLLGRKGKPRPKSHDFPYTGLIRCGECGCSVTAEEKTKLIKSTGEMKTYVYYHCTKKRVTGCNQKGLEVKELELQIRQCLTRIQLPDRLLGWALNQLETTSASEAKNTERALDQLGRQKDLIDRKLENLLQLKISAQNADGSLLSDEEYAAQKRKLLAEKLQMESAFPQGNERVGQTYDLTRETFLFSNQAVFWFTNGDMEKKRRIFSAIGSNYVLKEKILLIEAKKPLALIEETLNRLPAESARLEPAAFGSPKRKKGIESSLIPILSALVKDVRTFYREHHGKSEFKSLSSLNESLASGEILDRVKK